MLQPGTVHASSVNMRMLRLGRRRRDIAAQALREMGNFFGGGLVVGQFIRQGSVSIPVLVCGLVAWLVLGIAAVVCTEEERND